MECRFYESLFSILQCIERQTPRHQYILTTLPSLEVERAEIQH